MEEGDHHHDIKRVYGVGDLGRRQLKETEVKTREMLGGIEFDEFISGCIGGAAGVFVGQPFDTVKVRLQMQSTHSPQYKGIIDCFSTIFKQEGVCYIIHMSGQLVLAELGHFEEFEIRGLYKGMLTPLLGISLQNALLFGVKGNTLRLFLNEGQAPSEAPLLAHALSGAAGGAVQGVVLGPVELARIRMQMEGIGQKTLGPQSKYTGSVDAMMKVYRRHGLLRGCYRGYILTVARDVPGFFVYFGVYEYFKQQIRERKGLECLSRQSKRTGKKEVSDAGLLLAGGLAGPISFLASFPQDVMKTRLQQDGATGPFKYKGTLDVFIQSYRKEGWRVFGKGLGATLLRAIPVNAVIFYVEERTHDFIR